MASIKCDAQNASIFAGALVESLLDATHLDAQPRSCFRRALTAKLSEVGAWCLAGCAGLGADKMYRWSQHMTSCKPSKASRRACLRTSTNTLHGNTAYRVHQNISWGLIQMSPSFGIWNAHKSQAVEVRGWGLGLGWLHRSLMKGHFSAGSHGHHMPSSRKRSHGVLGAAGLFAPAHTGWPAHKGQSAGSRLTWLQCIPQSSTTPWQPPVKHIWSLKQCNAHATKICQGRCKPAEVTCSVRMHCIALLHVARRAACCQCQLSAPHQHSNQAALAICHQPLPVLRWLYNFNFQVLLGLTTAELNWTPFVFGYLVLPLHPTSESVEEIHAQLSITALPDA